LFTKVVPEAVGNATSESGHATAGLTFDGFDGDQDVCRPPSTHADTAIAPPETDAELESNAHEASDTTQLRAATAPPVGAELFANVELWRSALARDE